MSPTRILLVEDDSGDARLIRELLAEARGSAFQIERVDTLAGAMERLRAAPFAAVLLDLSLPDSCGLDTLLRLHRDAPRLPIVVLTGFDDQETAACALHGGAQDYLAKNTATPEVLRRAIDDAIERKHAEEQIAFQASLLDHVRHNVMVANPDGTVMYANGHAARSFGLRAEEVVGRRLVDVSAPERLRDDAAEGLRQVLDLGLVEGEFVGMRADGTEFPIFASLQRIDGADGAPAGVIAVSFDISDRKRAEAGLKDSEEFYRALYEQAQHPVLILDPALRIVDTNPYASSFYGYSAEEFRGMSLQDITAEPDRGQAAAVLGLPGAAGAALGQERAQVKRDGERVTVSINAVAVERGGEQRYVLTVTDISERKRTEQALEHRALHDTLTGLPNRTLFQDRLAQAIRGGQRNANSVALLLMDLDRFKDINDTFGHHYGDVLLQQLGERLHGQMRESDTIARLGGDEFAILLPGADDAGAVTMAKRVIAALDEPFTLEAQQLAVSASIGIALYPAHGLDAETLMRRADIAMYIAKRGGSGHAVYAAQLDQHSPARLALVGEMRHAIDAGQFVLHYQPLVGVVSGAATRVEALVRWQHPNRGFIPPDQFIPLAEQTGLIEPLTHWILNAAIAQCRLWQNAGLPLGVAVNLSTRTLHDPQLPDLITALLRKHGIEPNRLRLEVTESMIMHDPDRALDVLARLTAMGVRFSIDDFGTGYSSLSYLRRLPVDELKIDRSFVLEMTSDENDAMIVRSTIDLAHNLGLQVVAEGIENNETLEGLARLGCDTAQGYFLGRPMPPDALLTWMERPSTAPSTIAEPPAA